MLDSGSGLALRCSSVRLRGFYVYGLVRGLEESRGSRRGELVRLRRWRIQEGSALFEPMVLVFPATIVHRGVRRSVLGFGVGQGLGYRAMMLRVRRDNLDELGLGGG